MLIRLFLVVLLAWSPYSFSQGLYEHPESKLQFPAQLGHFERVQVNRYDDSRLGVQISYAYPGLGKADIYVFDYGFKDIPEGIQSDYVKSAYSSADKDIQTFADTARYLDFERLIPLGAVMKTGDGQPEWYVSAYKFRVNREGAEPMVSWLLVTGHRSHFLKVRFSHVASQAKTGRAEIGGLLQALAENNKQ